VNIVARYTMGNWSSPKIPRNGHSARRSWSACWPRWFNSGTLTA